MCIRDRALERAASLEAADVAVALEKASVALNGQAGSMRALDHQFQQQLVVGMMDRQGSPGVKFDVEGSGYGFRVIRTVGAVQAELPSSCRMARPS